MRTKSIPGHSIKWYVYAGGVKIPRQATMRGRWAYEVECSCGWHTRTGGGVRSYLESLVEDHKWDVANGYTDSEWAS